MKNTAIILSAALLTACSTATEQTSTIADGAGEPTVTPVEDVNANAADGLSAAVEDGGYHVAFDARGIDDDGTVEVEFFTYDMYAPADIDSIANGNSIVMMGRDMRVDAIEHYTAPDGAAAADINGGYENGGHTLRLEDDGYYRPVTLDGTPEYYSMGKRNMRIDSRVALTDDSDQVRRIDTSGIKALRSTANPQFAQNSTSVVVRNNVITHVNRIWVP